MTDALLAKLDTISAYAGESLAPAELSLLRRPLPSVGKEEPLAPRSRSPQEIIREAWILHEVDVLNPALDPYRVRVAYRLAREYARHLGLIGLDDALSSIDLARWSKPREALGMPSGPYCPAVREMLDEVRQFPSTRFGLESTREAGPPIQPPADNENLLHVWSRIMSAVGRFIGIEHGSPTEPEYGRLGLMGLITPTFAPQCWPSPIVLIQYEALLVDEIINSLIKEGSRHTHKSLYSVHGFTPHETRGLIRLGLLEMQAHADTDIEMDKAQLSLRLDDLISRARLACDQRVELGALKQLSIIRGVTRTEPEDQSVEFARVVKRVANEELPRGRD